LFIALCDAAALLGQGMFHPLLFFSFSHSLLTVRLPKSAETHKLTVCCPTSGAAIYAVNLTGSVTLTASAWYRYHYRCRHRDPYNPRVYRPTSNAWDFAVPRTASVVPVSNALSAVALVRKEGVKLRFCLKKRGCVLFIFFF
jgi:hypothetical protein